MTEFLANVIIALIGVNTMHDAINEERPWLCLLLWVVGAASIVFGTIGMLIKMIGGFA